MHPILFKPFGFAIYSYSFVLIVSFVLSVMLAVHLGRRRGPVNTEYVQELAMWGIIWGLIGSRLGWVLWNLDEYIAHPLRAFNLREGGMTILGGIVMPSLMLWVTARRRGIDVRNILDTFCAPLLLGMAVGRIGCVLHGCCFGDVCDAGFPLALTYPAGSFPHGLPVGPRYPAQFFEAAADLALMGLVIWMLPRITWAGKAFWTMLCGYGAIRFLNEFCRADGKMVGVLSMAQWVSLVLFVVGLLGVLGFMKKPPVDVRWQTGEAGTEPSSISPEGGSKKKKRG